MKGMSSGMGRMEGALEISSRRGFFAAFAATITIAAAGCGGGTTGTTHLASRSFRGAVTGNDGAAISAPVSVQASDDGAVLAATTSDSNGEFELLIPAADEEFAVVVTGVGDHMIRATLPVPSSAGADIRFNRDGTILRLNEARYDSDASNCLAMSFRERGFVLSDADESSVGAECVLEFETAVDGKSVDGVAGNLVADCGSGPASVAQATGNDSGRVRLSFRTSELAECTFSHIEFFTGVDGRAGVFFPIESP